MISMSSAIQDLKMLARWIICTAGLLLVLLSGNVAWADDVVDGPSLNPSVPFSSYALQHYRQRDGLPSDWIHDVLQTSDGFVWIATHNGLVRFDGRRFRVFNRANTPEMPTNDTRVLFQTRDKSLWIGTTGGLLRYSPGRPGRFQKFVEFDSNSVHAFYEDAAATLWIGTREATWRREVRGDFEVANELPRNVHAVCADDHGNLWFGTGSGLYVFANQEVKQVDHPRLTGERAGNPPGKIHALLNDSRGNLWIGAHIGILCVRDGQFIDTAVDAGWQLGRRQVFDLTETRDGQIYAATRHGLYRSDGVEPFIPLPTDEFTSCMAEDREGGMWVGHFGNRGLGRYANSNTQTVLPEQRVLCLHERTGGEMWFGTTNGLFCSRGNHMVRYSTAEGLPHDKVGGIAPRAGGGFWIGTNRGLARWTGSEIIGVENPQSMRELQIRSVLEDSGGTIWLALAGRGALTLRDDQLESLDSLAHGIVCWFYEDHHQRIWIGHEYGLYQHQDNKITRVTDQSFERLNSTHFICHYAARNGTLWLGTSGGIVRRNADAFQVFTSEQGLAADYIDRMVEDDHGNLWMGGRDGFFYVPIKDFDEVVTGKRAQVVSHQVSKHPGAPVSANHPKGCHASDGTTWLVGAHGVITIAPNTLTQNDVPPQVQIEDVRIDGNSLRGDTTFRFPAGRHRLAIHFSAPTFTNALDSQVMYRLDGHDQSWIDSGDERVAYYTDLSPGKYLFRVKASNGDGVWSDSDSTLDLEVAPRWWETRWFVTLAPATTLGLVILGTWYYTSSVRRRNTILRREIIERKRMESKLRISEERFRDLAQSTLAIPWEADATLRFTFVGGQAVDIVGFPVEDWLTEDFWIAHVHPEERLEALEFYQHAVERGGSHQFEYRMRTADGRFVWLHDVVHVVKEKGSPTKLRGFLVDVTSRRDAEDRAREYLGQLARINRAASMGEMATSVAHEVNQPLFAIVSNAQTAKRLLDLPDPDIVEVRDALTDIANDGNRASNIIAHIRSLVRKEKQPNQCLDLNEVAHEAIEFISPEIRRRGMALILDLADELPNVQGSSIELQQVILNFIINGIQSMRETDGDSRELQIGTLTADDEVELYVKDQGQGLDEEVSDRLFEPFFTTRPQGTGMGLAINRTIIDAHDGRIWATQNEEGGATFHFRLPVAVETKT